MADAYMPDVQVDIAFNAGYTTPAASRTWTDVSQYVELHQGIDITFGRQDERAVADANQLALTLDNSDGRFTAFRAASPYYPNVKVGRPIRVRVTPPGGSTVTRFVGFIDEWPVEWDGSDRYAMAKIRATSRLARLGLSTELQSMASETIRRLSYAMRAYWTMGDASGSDVASESSGQGAPALSRTGSPTPATAVTFGNATGPGFDGITAAEFFEKQCLMADFNPINPSISSGRFTMRATVLLNALPGVRAWLINLGGSLNGISITSAGAVQGIATGPVGNINDGATHDIMLTRDNDGLGFTETLYIDGAVAASATGTPVALSAYSGVYVGLNLTGVLAHVGIYPGPLDPTEAATQAQALLTGYAGDRTDQRAARVLGWAGVPTAETALDTGAETMTYQDTAGKSVVDALRDIESTEGGVLYDGRDGLVTFRNRSRRYFSTTAVTLDMAKQHVSTDYSPKLDRSALANDVTVSNSVTSASARVVDVSSLDEYGTASSTMTALSDSTVLAARADWLIAAYATPRIRVPSLSVDVLAHQGLTPSAQTLLGLTIGDVLAVSNAPTQADSTSASYFVEGYSERIGSESYGLTFNLSPTYPTLNVLVLDDATRGKLDTGLLAL